MDRARLGIMAIGVMLAATSRLEGQRRPREQTVDPVCDRVLPSVMVERISHRASLKLVPRLSITGSGGTCNYAEDGTRMILLVTISSPAKPGRPHPYDGYKRSSAYLKKQRDIAHLGDAAFSSGDYDQIVIVKKGERVVVVSAFFDYDKASRTMRGAYLTGDQVRQVAQAIVEKL